MMMNVQDFDLVKMAAERIGRARTEYTTQFQAMLNDDTPAAETAMAFAAGTLVSTVPVPFLDMALAMLVLRLAGNRLPKLPIMAAMALWNNLIMAPLYATTPRIGGYVLTRVALDMATTPSLDLVLRIVIGYLIIVATLTVFGYAAVRAGIGHYQARRVDVAG
jgi:hypothetical protein